MMLHITEEWLRKFDDVEEPGGIMACSPEIMKAAEEYAGSFPAQWDPKLGIHVT